MRHVEGRASAVSTRAFILASIICLRYRVTDAVQSNSVGDETSSTRHESDEPSGRFLVLHRRTFVCLSVPPGEFTQCHGHCRQRAEHSFVGALGISCANTIEHFPTRSAYHIRHWSSTAEHCVMAIFRKENKSPPTGRPIAILFLDSWCFLERIR